MKKALIGLWGLIQGFIGTWWNVIGIMFITHPDSGPGSKEWEEDKMFVPVGYAMVIIWLVAMFFSYYKLKSNKTNMALFSVLWVLGTLCYILLSGFMQS